MPEDPTEGQPEDDQELAAAFAFSSFLGPTAEGFAQRLQVLEQTRNSLLDEDQYLEWRASILSDLASPERFGSAFGSILYLPLVLAIALGLVGYIVEIRYLLYGGLFLVLVLSITIAVLAFINRRKMRLTAAERFLIVDHLLASSTISAEEASDLRSRIRKHHGEDSPG